MNSTDSPCPLRQFDKTAPTRSSCECLPLPKHFPSMEQRTVTFKCVYSYPSSLNPAWQHGTPCPPGDDVRKSSTPRAPRCRGWTWTRRHSSMTQLKFKAHRAEARQRHLSPAPQGTCFALPRLSVSLVLLHLDFLYGDWHMTLSQLTYKQCLPVRFMWPTIRTKKEWRCTGIDNKHRIICPASDPRQLLIWRH